jgi:YcxB-like protein
VIALDFTYTQQDCLRAWRRHFREMMKLRLDFLAAAGLAALGLWQWRAEGLSAWSIVALCSAAALALIILSALYFVPLMAYRRDDKLRRPYHLRFGEDGIEFRTDNLDSRIGWELYNRVLIDGYSYLLYHGKAQFAIVPKHVLQDDATSQRFERLLESKIKTVVRR